MDVEAIADAVNPPEANQRAQEIADRAVTLVTQRTQSASRWRRPPKPASRCWPKPAIPTSGQAFNQELKRRIPRRAIWMLDPTMPAAGARASLRELRGDRIRVGERLHGQRGAAGDYPQLIDIADGNGQAGGAGGDGQSHTCCATFRKSPRIWRRSARCRRRRCGRVKALLGEIPIRGHLPVTIPGRWRTPMAFGIATAGPRRHPQPCHAIIHLMQITWLGHGTFHFELPSGRSLPDGSLDGRQSEISGPATRSRTWM